IQAVWKHQSAAWRPGEGRIGSIGLPYLVPVPDGPPLLAPLIDVFALHGLGLRPPAPMIGDCLGFNLVILVLAFCAFWIDLESPPSPAAGAGTVFTDQFVTVSEAMTARDAQFDYPEITGVSADLAVVTHEHLDHNGVEALGASADVIRSTAGRPESRFGEVVAI